MTKLITTLILTLTVISSAVAQSKPADASLSLNFTPVTQEPIVFEYKPTSTEPIVFEYTPTDSVIVFEYHPTNLSATAENLDVRVLQRAKDGRLFEVRFKAAEVYEITKPLTK